MRSEGRRPEAAPSPAAPDATAPAANPYAVAAGNPYADVQPAAAAAVAAAREAEGEGYLAAATTAAGPAHASAAAAALPAPCQVQSFAPAVGDTDLARLVRHLRQQISHVQMHRHAALEDFHDAWRAQDGAMQWLQLQIQDLEARLPQYVAHAAGTAAPALSHRSQPPGGVAPWSGTPMRLDGSSCTPAPARAAALAPAAAAATAGTAPAAAESVAPAATPAPKAPAAATTAGATAAIAASAAAARPAAARGSASGTAAAATPAAATRARAATAKAVAAAVASRPDDDNEPLQAPGLSDSSQGSQGKRNRPPAKAGARSAGAKKSKHAEY